VILETHPRVRQNLRYVPQVHDGKSLFVVKDPLNLKYFRFGPVETRIMRLLDGTRSFRDAAAELAAGGAAIAADSIEAFFRRLRELGLTERTQEERRILLIETLRSQRQLRIQGDGNTLLRMRISFGDPDRLFDRMIEYLRFCFTPAFVVASILSFLLYLLILVTHWSLFTGGIAMLYTPSSYTLAFILTIYSTTVVIFAIHELGHGLTCKHFGGEVHEIGAMLIYFTPAFFCNVNDAWTFEKRSHRLWVTFAGGWVQLLIAAAAAVVWVVTQPGTPLHHVAFLIVILGGGLSILVNYNPLIPLDGYYALMDWLEIPNLRARSFEYLGARFKRTVLRLDVPLPRVTEREARVFLTYGILAITYTTTLLSLIGFWAGGLLVAALGAWGWAILLLVVWRVTRTLRHAALRNGRVWLAGRFTGDRPRRFAIGGAGALLGVVLLGLLPWTVRVHAPALVEPTQRSWIRAAEAGLVAEILAEEGAALAAGAPLALLRSPALELDWSAARARVATLEREAAAARGSGDRAHARRAELELAAARARATELERRRAALVLRAPYDGVVATPRVRELTGTLVARGDSLIEFWATGPLRARVLLAERDAGEVAAGTLAGIRFPVDASRTWRTAVHTVAPAALEDRVEAVAQLDAGAAAAGVRVGMLGSARLSVRRTTVAGATLRWARYTFRSDWLL
jgi:putative peptide zinc metalloprotease protein